MKKTKILIKAKGVLQNSDNFTIEYEKDLNNYINDGYKIVSSNFDCNGNFAYIYTLLEKEEVV